MTNAGYFEAFDALADTFCHNQRAFGIGVRENQSEFVTAKAGRSVDSAQLLAETIGEFAERFVTCIVTGRIVQFFESIEIQHQQRHGLVLPCGHLQFAIELHFERAPVVATGQRIGEGLLLHLRKQICVVDSHRNLVSDCSQ